MLRTSLALVTLVHLGQAAFAGPVAETAAPAVQSAEETRACAGMTNEGIKKRELMRELGAYLGEKIPEELAARANKHFAQVAQLKADCERLRSATAAAR